MNIIPKLFVADVNTVVKYVLTFQATGCPNGNLDPLNDPIQYWKSKSQDSVFDDMFLYCQLVQFGMASSTQIERCCGTSTCTPNACVKQTEWTLGKAMAYSFAILNLYVTFMTQI